ncbi:MAG: hypothetical protein M1840_002357 [Geoglossum simile]|nr:MAG: hypothetical protein M1840_002357 [Geoglossum simile]
MILTNGADFQGAYIKIYYGVGKFFEAVPADLEVELSYSSMGCQEVYPLPISGSDGGELQQTGYELDHAISGLSGSPSFSETISRLEDKNIQLKSELNNCRRLMEAETQLKESTEAELERTKMALKNLQERFRKLVVTHSFYRTKAHKLQKGFSEIHKLSQQFQETTNVRPLTHV